MKLHPEDFISLFRKYRSNSFLEKTDEYEESLLAAFKAIYNSLKDKEQTVFNQLAVFPTSFDTIASSQVCEENGSCLKVTLSIRAGQNQSRPQTLYPARLGEKPA